jgi:hypothetical protein
MTDIETPKKRESKLKAKINPDQTQKPNLVKVDSDSLVRELLKSNKVRLP